jgi:steroid delta-isomerase
MGQDHPALVAAQKSWRCVQAHDKHLGPSTIQIEPHESHVAANESAHVMTLSMTFPNGVKSRVRGIFTYRVDDEGKLTNLRGYWNIGEMELEQPA